MVALFLREPNLLAITFERDGEEPERLVVADGGLAMVGALGLILARRTLLAGDRQTVPPYRMSGRMIRVVRIASWVSRPSVPRSLTLGPASTAHCRPFS
jgi:hypothetical protein